MGIRLPKDGNLIRSTLRSARVFGSWPEGERATLYDEAQLWQYAKGDVLCQFGDVIEGLWIVVEGSLLSHRDNQDGRRMIHGIAMPGEQYGIVSVLDGKTAFTTLSVRSPAVVLFLPQAAVLASLRRNPDLLFETVLYFCNRFRLEYERAQTRLNDSLRCQLAKFILFFSGEDFRPAAGETSAELVPLLTVTQEEIAAMMGVSRQSVSELMAAMARDGVLGRKASQFYVLDYVKLLAIMEEDGSTTPEWRAFVLARHEALMERRAATKPNRLAAAITLLAVPPA